MKIGDKVRWGSQAGGHQTVKEGVIVYILKKGENCLTVHATLFPDCRRMFDWSFDYINRPLVIVENGKNKPKLYKPNPKKLEIVE